MDQSFFCERTVLAVVALTATQQSSRGAQQSEPVEQQSLVAFCVAPEQHSSGTTQQLEPVSQHESD